MIKFFRKIRRKMLTENRFSKYFLYAIGEIVLVIIGILIALSINNRNEQKKTEAKIEKILEDILNNLRDDIASSGYIILQNRKLDSLSSKVLNTELTFADYKNDNSGDYLNLVLGFSIFQTSNNSYNLLMNNVNDIPEKYNDIVYRLNFLYTQNRPYIIRCNNNAYELINRNLNDFEENYSWFSEFRLNGSSDDAINYMLTDYRYKNKVSRLRSEVFETLGYEIINYRIASIEVYKQISKILNKSNDSENFIINDSTLKKYKGLYSSDTGKTYNFTLNSEFELILTSNENKISYIYSLGTEFIYFDYMTRSIIRFKENKSNETISMTIYSGHTSVEYIKSK